MYIYKRIQVDIFSGSYHTCIPAPIQIKNQNITRIIICRLVPHERFGQEVYRALSSLHMQISSLDPNFPCLGPVFCPSLEDRFRLFPGNSFPESRPTFREILQPSLRQYEHALWSQQENYIKLLVLLDSLERPRVYLLYGIFVRIVQNRYNSIPQKWLYLSTNYRSFFLLQLTLEQSRGLEGPSLQNSHIIYSRPSFHIHRSSESWHSTNH